MFRLLKLILIICLFSSAAFSKNYISAGAVYSIPVFNSSKTQGESIGGAFSYESRRFCNLWLGLKVNYYALDTLTDIDNNYKSGLSFSPYARYAFTKSTEPCGKLIPFAHLQISLSSFEGTYSGTPLGVGGSLGFGAAYPFHISKANFSIEIMADLSAPNLLRGQHYPPLYLANVTFMLSIGI